MKKLKPFYLLLFTLILVSCDDSDDVTQIDFNQTITTALDVDITEDSNGQPLSFTADETIDFTTVQEIQDNIDEIQDATIDALSYEVDNFVGAANTTVTSASINFNGTTIQVSNINLEQADNNDTIFSVDDPAALTAIENALQNDTQATVTLSGNIDSAPASFDVIIYLDVIITSSLN
jgi:hypothetical protein